MAPGPVSAAKPSFNAKDPASYAWGAYDAVLAEAQRLHWSVLLTVTAPAPRWATSNRKAPYITRPDAKDFREFMYAVAHAIHHYALIAVMCGILDVPVPAGFGVAPSTLKYHAEQPKAA